MVGQILERGDHGKEFKKETHLARPNDPI